MLAIDCCCGGEGRGGASFRGCRYGGGGEVELGLCPKDGVQRGVGRAGTVGGGGGQLIVNQGVVVDEDVVLIGGRAPTDELIAFVGRGREGGVGGGAGAAVRCENLRGCRADGSTTVF